MGVGFESDGQKLTGRGGGGVDAGDGVPSAARGCASLDFLKSGVLGAKRTGSRV